MRFDAPSHQLGGGRAEAVLLGGEHPHHLPTAGRDLCQHLDFLLGDGPGGRADGLGEAGEDLGVFYAIGLGQPARGSGELTRLPRVYHRDRQPRGSQSRGHGSFEASGGLQDHQSGTLLCEAGEERFRARGVVGDAKGLAFPRLRAAP